MSAPLRQQTLFARSVLQCHHSPIPTASNHTHIQRRTFLGNLFGRGKDKSKFKATQKAENPFLADMLSRKSGDARRAAEEQQRNRPRGDLSASSLFSTPEDIQAQNRRRRAIDAGDETHIQGQRRNLQDLAVALDPEPRKRERWQRRRVIASLRRRERPTAEQFRRMTEREITVHSPNLKTSVKKLGPLARQIQGKTVEEAIVQMRFSKKKIAQQVREHLEYARDKAVVARGMGLGEGVEGEEGKSKEVAVDIQRKDGSRQTVSDKSEIYVDQAWVGRGPYGKLPDYRARGRMNLIRTPWTHLALKLKEQGTLVREWQDREAKRQKKRAEKVWVPLPDRPLHGQNQYYTW